MEPTEPVTFLDVPRLLDSSEPRGRVPWIGYALGLLLVVVLAASLAGKSREGGRAVEVLAALVAVMALIFISTVVLVRRLRREQQEVDAAAELVQLRRWPDAAMLLDRYLSRPARTQQLRSQALTYLATVLARYHRFGDAIAVQQHLLDHGLVGGPMEYAMRVGRAMAILREDHLFDADRAISELRRAGGGESAGLALVEMYRDVITGHAAEALAIFDAKLPVLRDQLGHRVADAWALAARAHDLRGQEPEARAAFHNATLLAPAVELFRRYPEVKKLEGKCEPAPAPREAT